MFRLVFTGDSLIQHGVTDCTDPGFLAVCKLVSGADLAITNLEVCIQTGEDAPAFVAGGGRGTTYMASPPSCIGDLQAIGFSMVTTANNHALDFGESGVVTSRRHLAEAGMAAAGTGASLREASAPVFLDTPKGRIALLAVCDWGERGLADLTFPWPYGAAAADADPAFKSRPGMNLLRYSSTIHVDAEALVDLRRISEALGWELAKDVRSRGGGRSEPLIGEQLIGGEIDDDETFHFMGRRFRCSDRAFTFETHAFDEDIERNVRWVEHARVNADWVFVGLHQQGASRSESEPPDHAKEFAHAVIDAGADAFIAHGRGRIGGIEVRRGRPIIYGVPGFINQLEQMPAVPVEQLRRYGLPADATPTEFVRHRRAGEANGKTTAIGRGLGGFMPMALHEIIFSDDRVVTEVRLTPIEQIGDGAIGQRGLPRTLESGSATSQRTVEAIEQRMLPWGWDVTMDHGVAVIDLTGAKHA